jgi:selenide,water dikinase
LSEQGIASTLLPQLEPLRHKCQIDLKNEALLNCLLDPQTQGGLLIALPPSEAESLLEGGTAWKIGEVVPAEPYSVRVV